MEAEEILLHGMDETPLGKAHELSSRVVFLCEVAELGP